MLIIQSRKNNVHVIAAFDKHQYYAFCGKMFSKQESNVFAADNVFNICDFCRSYKERYINNMLNNHIRRINKALIYDNNILLYYKNNIFGRPGKINKKYWTKLAKFKYLVNRTS